MESIAQPIKWHGGKHYLARQIIELMPKHTHYVEPFFGGGSVLLQKPFEGVSEVVNDLHGELTNFWRILQHEILFDKFKRIIEAMPFSTVEFEDAIEGATKLAGIYPDRIPDGIDRVQRAVRFFVQARQSRQGLMKDFATMSRNRVRRGMNEQVSSWLTSVEGLDAVHARFRRVVIFNEPALNVVKREDGENTLAYIDAPYIHETRVTTSDYKHEMTLQDHAALIDTIVALESQFVVSMYHHPIYDALHLKHGWELHEIEIPNNASSAKVKEIKTECLWIKRHN